MSQPTPDDAPPDLSRDALLAPFLDVRKELRQKGLSYGGGTGEAFRHAVALLDTAFTQVGQEVPR